MGILPNPYVILGVVAFYIASVLGVGGLMYMRGRDDMKAAYTAQQLAQANTTIEGMKHKQAVSDTAGEVHDQHTNTVRETTREIVKTVTIPADADPFLPVGFVRLFDRAASRNIGADPYPGKSDGDPSDVRVSEAGSLLAGTDFARCEENRVQLSDLIAYLKADRAPEKMPGWLDNINPFN